VERLLVTVCKEALAIQRTMDELERADQHRSDR
jgi:hypothetical protein